MFPELCNSFLQALSAMGTIIYDQGLELLRLSPTTYIHVMMFLSRRFAIRFGLYQWKTIGRL
jgi:hypothetical protein